MSVNNSFNPSISWEKKVWTSGGAEDDAVIYLLKDLLKEKDLECKQVSKIRYGIEQNLMDQVFSIFPYWQRMTIKLEVETKSSDSVVKDDFDPWKGRS